MDIYLSVNNRADILTIPVIPPSFSISKPQNLTKFETISNGDLQLIGDAGLESITIESFFPVREYPYLRDRSMQGWEYVEKIDGWIEDKLPIRLIITDTPVNMAVAVKSFNHSMKSDSDIWYTLELEEMPLLGYENQSDDEEEIDLAKAEEFEKRITALEALVNELANPMIYNYVDENMPEWARTAVENANKRGCLEGTGSGFNLKYDDLRHLTILDRAGLFGFVFNYNDMNIPDWASRHVTAAIDNGYLEGVGTDESGNTVYFLTEQGLRFVTMVGRTGAFDKPAQKEMS